MIRQALGVMVRPAVDRIAAVCRLAPVERYATDGETACAMVEGCEMLDVIEAGQEVGAVAVSIDGVYATIKAAVNHGKSTAEALELIEADLKARGVQHVAFFTKRPGLIRSMLARGYRVREAELEKAL